MASATPDSRLPHPFVSVSIHDWLYEHDQLLDETEDPDEQIFLSTYFGLTSRRPSSPTLQSLDLHADSFNLLPPADQNALSFNRDFDSLIGVFHEQLPVIDSVSVFTIPRPKGRLQKNVSVYVDLEEIGYRNVGIHAIPNWEFGTIQNVYSINVAFPSMYNPAGNETITEEHYAQFYNLAVHPAVEDHLADNLSHWPATYQSETLRARSARGAITHTSHTV
ncbi:hypothetical protein FRB90_012196, partial [Tulasnella sp. 427]